MRPASQKGGEKGETALQLGKPRRAAPAHRHGQRRAGSRHRRVTSIEAVKLQESREERQAFLDALKARYEGREASEPPFGERE